MPKVLTNRRVQFLSVLVVVLLVVPITATVGVANVMRASTEDVELVIPAASASRMYDRHGNVVANLHGEFNRTPVPLQTVPEHLLNAVITIEDRRFFDHDGVDIRGVARAALMNVWTSGRQGGSTLSQQLAKNLFFHGEPRTLGRKAVEAVLSIGLEELSEKEQILEAYLNTAFFGRGTYGVQAAARSYFRKDVTQLDLAESAFLAGIIHLPGRYDFRSAETPDQADARRANAIERRNVVLSTMVGEGYISREEAEQAALQPIEIHPPADPRWNHPYFVDAVLRELGVLRNQGQDGLDERYDFLGDTMTERANTVYAGGLRIYTTMDPVAQENAERAVAEQLPERFERLSSAVASVDPGTGAVRALVGGRDYYPQGCDSPEGENAPICRHAKVNLALGNVSGGTGRQPGSAFKTMVLAAALEEGGSLRQQLDGSPFEHSWGPHDHQKWRVTNYAGGGGGSMDVISAMNRSVNAAFARLQIQYLGRGDALAGSAKVAEVSRRLGINFPPKDELVERCGDRYGQYGACAAADDVPAIALGAKEVSPLEMAAAYAAFANDGVYARPTMIDRIEDANGNVLYQAEAKTHRAVSVDTARGVTHSLEQVVRSGTGRAAALGRPTAGKTGTSQAWRDAWFVGYVPQLSTAVWVGNPVPVQRRDGSWIVESMTASNGYGRQITGSSYPTQIWEATMRPTVEHLPVEGFAAPSDAVWGPSERLSSMRGEEEDLLAAEGEGEEAVRGTSGVSQVIQMRREGRNVVVHRECPPGGGTRGGEVWKTEERNGTTHVYRSRAVCR